MGERTYPMATAAQIAANRANARLSTGPTSPGGKTRSSQNNFRHGCRSRAVVLPGDDPAEYDALLADLTAEFRPRGLTEERYVREMGDAEWRLRRCRAHQQKLVTAKIEELTPLHTGADPITLQALAFEALHTQTGFAQFLRYESKFERQYDRAYNGLIATRDKVKAHNARSLEAQIHAFMNAPVPGHREPQPRTLPHEPNPAGPDAPAQPRNLPFEPNSVTRSAPCPCGSGLKYKRCCGRTR